MIEKKKKKDDFNLNTEDERFKAIFEKNDYAIDPTHKYYKEETSGKLLK